MEQLTILLVLFFFVQFWIGFRLYGMANKLNLLSSSLDKIGSQLEDLQTILAVAAHRAQERKTEAQERLIERYG